MPYDIFTKYYRCDFVAYRPDMTAIRLHPAAGGEAYPIVVENIRTLAVDWQAGVDPYPSPSLRAEMLRGDIVGPIFLRLGLHDEVQLYVFKAWLDGERHGPLRDVTTAPCDKDHCWFPWPVLLVSHEELLFLRDTAVRSVATCRLHATKTTRKASAEDVGLMFRRGDNGKVVTVTIVSNELVVLQGAPAVSSAIVKSVFTSEWWHGDGPPQPAQPAMTGPHTLVSPPGVGPASPS